MIIWILIMLLKSKLMIKIWSKHLFQLARPKLVLKNQLLSYLKQLCQLKWRRNYKLLMLDKKIKRKKLTRIKYKFNQKNKNNNQNKINQNQIQKQYKQQKLKKIKVNLQRYHHLIKAETYFWKKSVKSRINHLNLTISLPEKEE